MPRESIHWYVLEQSAQRVSSSCPCVTAAISQSRSQAFLGAIAHDAPYYFKLGRSNFEHVAEYLHGASGEHTLHPVQLLLDYALSIPTTAEAAREAGADAAQPLISPAFPLGMLSHIAADSVFHPLIYFLTGDYYAEDKAARLNARRLHRLFEVYLDEYCVEEFRKTETEFIADLLNDAATDPTFPKLIAALNSLSEKLCSIEGHWAEALYDLGWAQRLFLSPIRGIGLRMLATAVPPLRPIEALSRFGRRRIPDVFRESLDYRNPVSGESFSLSVSELLEQSILRTVEYFESAELFLSKKNPIPLQGIRAPSLNFDLSTSKATDARYFSDAPLRF